MISFWTETLAGHRNSERDICLDMSFHCWDDGDAYTQINVEESSRYTVPGTLYITQGDMSVDISKIGKSQDQVRIVATWQQASSNLDTNQSHLEGEWKVQGFVRRDGSWQEVPVQVMPLRKDLFSRSKGLLDSEVLSDACVFVAGLGSVGSFAAELLAMSGVMNFILLDYQRSEVANICRQRIGVSGIGRYKTKITADVIGDKNPFAQVETHEMKITYQNQEFVRGLVRRSDVVIGPVDNREPRSVLNRLCVEENKPLLLMGAFHRAHGVQIIFTRRPRIDPCYECYLMSRPPEVKNQWSSNLDQGRQTDYADHPVEKVEPGLAVDIMPMNVMTVKLCINQLLKDKSTTLRSLDDDLTAPYYVYLNRREGTYEKLEPLGLNAGNGKTHILSWHGIDLKRNKACPVCGDSYVEEMSKAHGVSVSPADIDKYKCKTGKQQDA
jgi:molybdopterin/thiamine biosynthesis adenylyltransferase